VDDLLAKENPHQIAFAFDESLQTSHRKEIYPDYKNNRSPAPDSLRKQFKLCRSFIQALGIHQDASLHYEADDLIGTWAQSLRHQNIAVNIITADKDLAQLVHENDHWWEYNRGNKLDSKAITKKFRVKPRQIADQLAIAGDKADNIPGVPRVGMATAAKLLKKFDNIDNLLSSIDDIAAMQIRGAKLIQESIYDHQDSIRLSRKLTGIECEIETVNTDVFRISTFDKGAFSQISTQLGLSQNTQKRWLTLINDLNK
jgi:5'-3' exonuclease